MPRASRASSAAHEDGVEVLVVLVVLAAVIWLVVAPLRRGATERAAAEESAEHAELEARKEAKYREIRDAELDHRTGKLSDADYRAIDRELRAEAVELLRRLDAIEGREGGTARH
jgi:flagellar biosynthesis/type III secretory pathway M-ring protein FliF/YscJ